MRTAPNELAMALARARREGVQLNAADWKDSLAGGAQQAYLVQHRVADSMKWFEKEGVPTFWKSGGPSRDATLTHAPLAAHGVRVSPADFCDMRFHAPGVEAEIAVRLGQSVTPAQAAALTADTVAALLDSMAVSIEVVDSRFAEGAQAPALLRLADSQSHGALALGEWVPFVARDWQAQACSAQVNDDEPIVHTGTHALGDPAWLLPIWLRHVTHEGATVPAGTMVTTGTWIGIVPVRAGDRVAVEFPGIGGAELRL